MIGIFYNSRGPLLLTQGWCVVQVCMGKIIWNVLKIRRGRHTCLQGCWASDRRHMVGGA
jgi:hypothetical protein